MEAVAQPQGKYSIRQETLNSIFYFRREKFRNYKQMSLASESSARTNLTSTERSLILS